MIFWTSRPRSGNSENQSKIENYKSVEVFSNETKGQFDEVAILNIGFIKTKEDISKTLDLIRSHLKVGGYFIFFGLVRDSGKDMDLGDIKITRDSNGSITIDDIQNRRVTGYPINLWETCCTR